MEKNAQLNFQLNFRTNEFNNLELPVEIRRFDFALVDQTLSSEPVNVEPGSYVISTLFPAGQKITQIQEVTEGENQITIEPPEEIASPFESHEETHFLNRDCKSLPLTKTQDMKIGLIFFKRDQSEAATKEKSFKRFFQPGNVAIDILSNTVLEIKISKSPDQWLAQLVQANQPALNFVLPVSTDTFCKIILTFESDRYQATAQPENLEASLLLRYREEGRFDQVGILSKSKKIDPERLLHEKKKDPIAAAVGAYTILKFGELRRLHNWTENLKNWFEWLPDGAAIRGEHLARIGDDVQALDSFLLLQSRGLPFFNDGFNYSITRLRDYIGSWSNYFTSDAKLAKAKNLLKLLQRFEPFIDFNKPVSTFTGEDPNEPDDKIIQEGAMPTDFDIDIKELLR